MDIEEDIDHQHFRAEESNIYVAQCTVSGILGYTRWRNWKCSPETIYKLPSTTDHIFSSKHNVIVKRVAQLIPNPKPDSEAEETSNSFNLYILCLLGQKMCPSSMTISFFQF
jgi:hypothetical protein